MTRISSLTIVLLAGLACCSGQQLNQAPGAPNGLLGGLQLDSLLGGGQQQQGMNRQAGLLGGLGNLGGLTSGLGGLTSGLGGLTNGLLGGQQMPQGNQLNMMQQQGGPLGQITSLLQQLPQRGMELLNQLLTRLGGLGRNQQMGPGMMMSPQQQQQQQQQRLLQGQNPLNLAAPLTDALSQGRMPDVNQLANGLTNQLGAGNLVPGLTRSLSGMLNGATNGAAQNAAPAAAAAATNNSGR